MRRIEGHQNVTLIYGLPARPLGVLQEDPTRTSRSYPDAFQVTINTFASKQVGLILHQEKFSFSHRTQSHLLTSSSDKYDK